MGKAKTKTKTKAETGPDLDIDENKPPELTGLVTESGDIRLDVTDMKALGRRLSYVRKQKAKYDKEDKRLTSLVRGHRLTKVGFENDFIRIGSADEVDGEDEALLKALEDAGKLAECLQPKKLSIKKLRVVAKENKKIAKALEQATGKVRRVKIL